MAELTEMASGMISSIGGLGDTVGRPQTLVEDERTKTAGRAPAAKDFMDMAGGPPQEGKQNAPADQAPADFSAKEGNAPDPSSSSATPAAGEGPVKSMGPQTEKN